MEKPTPKFETVSITRIDHKSFEIEMDGVSVRIKQGDQISGCPRCWHTVNELYAAVRAVHGVSKGKRYN